MRHVSLPETYDLDVKNYITNYFHTHTHTLYVSLYETYDLDVKRVCVYVTSRNEWVKQPRVYMGEVVTVLGEWVTSHCEWVMSQITAKSVCAQMSHVAQHTLTIPPHADKVASDVWVCQPLSLCILSTISRYFAATHCNTLQHTATHCNTLQHTATHCNTLQHTATHCNTLQYTAAVWH